MNTNRTRLTASYATMYAVDPKTNLPSMLIFGGTNTNGTPQEVRIKLDEAVQRILRAHYVPDERPTFVYFGNMDTCRGRLAKWLLNGGSR